MNKMAYLGRFQLGATVPLYLQCRNSSRAPTLPDRPPQYKVFLAGATAPVEAHLMPIIDRYIVTGLFRSTQFLGRLYVAGMYQVCYYYNIAGSPVVETDNFEIVGGGSVNGAVVSTYFLARPEANYIVQGLESGQITKGRNPRV